jgi:hypothetical protein
VSAIFSPCGLYRYRLEREVQPDGIVAALIGVNPSIANDTVNDQTIRKDIGFAERHGWRRLVKGNIFGYVSTKVGGLARVEDPVGPGNAVHLDSIIEDADIIIPCWGSRRKIPKKLHKHLDALALRLVATSAAGKPVLCFGRTATGDPTHPLMLGYDTKLVPFAAPSREGGGA